VSVQSNVLCGAKDEAGRHGSPDVLTAAPDSDHSCLPEDEPSRSCMTPTGVGEAPVGALGDEELAAADEAQAPSLLRSVCRVYAVSAGSDGGRFDRRAACAATAVLRISSGSVLFTRSALQYMLISTPKFTLYPL
jgi:hypothetical protein